MHRCGVVFSLLSHFSQCDISDRIPKQPRAFKFSSQEHPAERTALRQRLQGVVGCSVLSPFSYCFITGHSKQQTSLLPGLQTDLTHWLGEIAFETSDPFDMYTQQPNPLCARTV